MGINLLRRWLVYWYAKGTVLEVGAGTGRNIPYFSRPSVKRVVLVDTCNDMLEIARRKLQGKNQKHQPQYAFIKGDSAHLDQLPDGAFDTVIDTFGLCSYDDPVAVIREMIRLCKESGTILLLEHGRSKTWSIVTNHLDKHAEQHAANWGCVWNRDLDAILFEASDAEGLEIIHLHKFHFGTTYLIVARRKVCKDKNKLARVETNE
jgi:methyltransferase OMS1